MWRTQSTHERAETEYLDQAILRLETDVQLKEHADATLKGVAAQEPLIAQSFNTPQDPLRHAEGPFLDAHLRRMLIMLYAMIDEKLHLIDLEEFRRMKGYEGEIDELEEVLKEKVTFFETFILVHDVAKQYAVTFSSLPHSRGERFGFNTTETTDPMVDQKQRHTLLEQYHRLFERFQQDHVGLTPRQLQQAFFRENGIGMHHPHHDRMMYAPMEQHLVSRLAEAHQLTDRDQAMLQEVVARHLEFEAFHQVNLSMAHWILHLAKSHHFDVDDFLDVVQGCVWLDWVCGSMHAQDSKTSQEIRYLTNLFISEHQLIPERRQQRFEQREKKQREQRNRFFQAVGLDGTGLMELLHMQPGPELGAALRTIQKAVLGEGTMPHYSPAIDKEIERRTTAFFKKTFVSGD